MSIIEKIKYMFSFKKAEGSRLSKKEEVFLAFFENVKAYSSCDSIKKEKLEELQNIVANYKTYCFNKKITAEEEKVIDLFLLNILQNIKKEEVKKHLRLYLDICSKITSLDAFKNEKKLYPNFIDTFISDVSDFINLLNIRNSYNFYDIGSFIDVGGKSDFFNNFYSKASYAEKVEIQAIFLTKPKLYKNVFPEKFDLLPENITIFLDFIDQATDTLEDKKIILNDYKAYLYKPVIEKIINTDMLFPKSDMHSCANLLEDINDSFLSVKDVDKYEKIKFYKKSFSFLSKKEGVSEAFKNKVSCFPLLYDKNIDCDIAGTFIFENYYPLIPLLKDDYYGYGYEINRVVRENKFIAPALFSHWASEAVLSPIFDMVIFKKSHMFEGFEEFDETLWLMKHYIDIVGEEKIAKRDTIFKEVFSDYHNIYDDDEKIYMDYKIDGILDIVYEYPLIGKKIIKELFCGLYMNNETRHMLRREPVSVVLIQDKIKEKGIKINTLELLDILKDNIVSADEFIGFLNIEFDNNITEKFINDNNFISKVNSNDYEAAWFLLNNYKEKKEINESLISLNIENNPIKRKRL